jgi:membrane fusion protein, multidrug efflux system
MFENEQSVQPRSSSWQEVMKMIKRHPKVFVLLAVLVTAGILFFALRPSQATTAAATKTAADEKAKAEDKKLPVEIAVAKKGSISSWIITTSTLEPERQVTILSETTGVVDKLMVDEGATVKEGQVIAMLSDSQKTVALQKAQISVGNAKHELERKQTSYDQKLISQQDYDKSKFDMDVANSEFNTSQVEVDRLTIRAPFSGTITDRFIQKGQNIAIGAQMFTILDRDPLKARIYLPEKEVFGLTQNQKVNLSLNAQKNVSFDGTIDQINPAVDTKTGTVKVTVLIPNAPASVRPGSFVDVRLVTQKHDNTLLIPKKAIVEEAGEQYVFLILKGLATRHTVKIGFTDDESAEVLSGINQGESVVIAGQGSLRDGVKTETVATR